ncbi:hypothetical protein D3C76_1314240 [compost metagenome]
MLVALAHVVEYWRGQFVQADFIVDAYQLQLFASGKGVKICQPGIAQRIASVFQHLLEEGVAVIACWVADPGVVAKPSGANAVLRRNAQYLVAAITTVERKHCTGKRARHANVWRNG